MKIHLPDEEKPFKCQYCPRTFAYNHDCVHHMRLHVGEKPFQCTQCDMAFHRKSYLTEHMFVHTGVSKYRCDECQVSSLYCRVKHCSLSFSLVRMTSLQFLGQSTPIRSGTYNPHFIPEKYLKY